MANTRNFYILIGINALLFIVWLALIAYGLFMQSDEVQKQAKNHSRWFKVDLEDSADTDKFDKDILPDYQQDKDIKQARARDNEGKYKVVLIIEGAGLEDKKLDYIAKLPKGSSIGVSPYTTAPEKLSSELEELKFSRAVNIPFKSDYFPRKLEGKLVIKPERDAADNTKNLDRALAPFPRANAYYIRPDQDLSKYGSELSSLKEHVKEKGSKLILSNSHKNYYKKLKPYFEPIESNIFFIDKDITSINNQKNLMDELLSLSNSAKAKSGIAVGLVEANKLTVETIIKWRNELPPDIEVVSLSSL
jgi:polysaccharide deacetylase 2 family uncharacterized protein YibQ